MYQITVANLTEIRSVA